MKWIKIIEGDKSTLPPVGQRVLCVSEEGGMCVEQRFNGADYIYTHQIDEGSATHWMPLPNLPSE